MPATRHVRTSVRHRRFLRFCRLEKLGMLIGEWVPDFLKAERVEVFEVGQ